jgi:hypothetical protein
MKNLLIALAALILGFAGGLAYSWGIAPVKYVDAEPALLRADFKDQYRIVIAASYASSYDLARARARLLLFSTDPVADVKAQAQRMVGASENAASVDLLVQLAADLEKGVAKIPPTSTPMPTSTRLPFTDLPPTETLTFTPPPTLTPEPTFTPIITPVLQDGMTPAEQPEVTLTPRPTSTSTPDLNAPFMLVGQDTVCDPGVQPGLMQFKLIDAHRRQVPGIEIIVISVEGEDHFFTGFKPDVGIGYADFVMKENASYSVRIGEGGTFITNLSAPTCTDPNGVESLGGLSLSFQQP